MTGDTVNKWQIENGCLLAAGQVASPNFNQRPDGCPISLLVIHNISLPAGHFGGPYIQQLFANCLDTEADACFADLGSLQVSAHLLIDRNGVVTQFVNFDQRAWHAGVSSFAACENCNDYSIGIELEGCDQISYTVPQYDQLVSISQLLMRYYPAITLDRIVGHSDVAPARKTDPGPAFDWGFFRQRLLTKTTNT